MNDNTSSPNHSRSLDRRTVLSGVSGTLVALAGCTDNPDTGSDTSTDSTDTTTDSPASQSNVFTGVRFDGGQLVVTLASDTSVDWVRRFGPEENLSEKAKVSPDGTQAQFDLVGQNTDGYTPGTHRLVAVKNDETLGEMPLDLTPDVALTDFRWAKNHPDMEWDKSANNWETHASFVLENTGSGPAMLARTRWRDAPFVLRTDEDEQAFDHTTPLPPGETTTVYARPPVYETSGGLVGASAVECENIDAKTLQLTAVVEPGANLSYLQTIEYGGEEGACELTIVDRETAGPTQTAANGSDT
ncbi:hypothetical protein [Halobacterium sp. CBA1126]|uniref:hypothetical protein n=1 Tax=Halobacterium sp. CBA1126 TaxID=2668074 RepID=UPI0012F98172|nr:hypothetical protein [Halobacterium sp. CBA1126]MUV59371.1 hypothetical protein [Halobacterium sp. CBA1126]